jgi:hypothetical protein
MIASAKTRATYADVLASPANVDRRRCTFASLRRRRSKAPRARSWVLVDVWHDDARVRAEPFEAFTLELDALWS